MVLGSRIWNPVDLATHSPLYLQWPDWSKLLLRTLSAAKELALLSSWRFDSGTIDLAGTSAIVVKEPGTDCQDWRAIESIRLIGLNPCYSLRRFPDGLVGGSV